MSQTPEQIADWAEQLTCQTPDPAVQMSGRDYGRLSLEDLADIVRLTARGLSQRKIAEMIGCSQQSVCYALQRMAGTHEDIKAVAKAKTLKVLSKWEQAIDVAALRGDHRPAREFVELAHSELRPQPSGSAGGGGVTVIVGMPQAPVQLPSIEAKATFRQALSPASEGESQAVSD